LTSGDADCASHVANLASSTYWETQLGPHNAAKLQPKRRVLHRSRRKAHDAHEKRVDTRYHYRRPRCVSSAPPGASNFPTTKVLSTFCQVAVLANTSNLGYGVLGRIGRFLREVLRHIGTYRIGSQEATNDHGSLVIHRCIEHAVKVKTEGIPARVHSSRGVSSEQRTIWQLCSKIRCDLDLLIWKKRQARLSRRSKVEHLEAKGNQDIALIRTRGKSHQGILVRMRSLVAQVLPSGLVRGQRVYQTWSLTQGRDRSRHEPDEEMRKKEESGICPPTLGEVGIEDEGSKEDQDSARSERRDGHH
ncbi:RhoGAP-domain-containing protein, partial [Aureobasidium melanogenum]